MSIPKVRAEASGKSREGSRQAVRDNEGAGARIREALGDREVSWLSRETGYGDSTIRDALRRGPVRSDVAVAIAKALGVSVGWILTDVTSPSDRAGDDELEREAVARRYLHAARIRFRLVQLAMKRSVRVSRSFEDALVGLIEADMDTPDDVIDVYLATLIDGRERDR